MVADANVLVSAVLFPRSLPAGVVCGMSARGVLTLSPDLLIEAGRVLGRPKFRRYGPVEEMLGDLATISRSALVLDPPPLATPVCRDPDDDHVLALALHAEAGWIVTGDRDLLVLDPWEGIRIVTPGDVE